VILILLAILLAAPACGGRATHKKPKDKYEGMTAREIYDLGKSKLDQGKNRRARDLFQAALGRQDISADLVAEIHLGLADSYFRSGGVLNLAEALSRYTNFLTFYPDHEKADYVQYQLGLCYLRQTLAPDRDKSQARKALAELVKVERQYPNSEYVQKAYDKANQARQLLAEHDFRIGDFYFKRGAYKGAVDRFKEILEEYPLYTRKEEIYLRLGESLIRLERADEGRIYLQKLLAEYPESPQATHARGILFPSGQALDNDW